MLALITLAVKALGFGEKQVIAYYFGTSEQVDAYFVAVSLATVLFLFAREIVEPAFLPLFVRHLDAGDQGRAWQLFTAVAAGILCLSIAAVTAGIISATGLATLLAPGFSPAAQQLTARLIQLTVAGGALLSLSALTSITLNGYRRFALPASGDLVLKAAPVLAACLLAPRLGIVALAIGLVIGCSGRLLVHLSGLVRELRWLAWPQGHGRDDLRRLAWLMAPLLLGVLFSQLSALADNYFASQVGSGAVAARTYAQKIVDLPILLLPYALSIVIFPYFSSLACRGESDRLYRTLGQTVRGLTMVFSFLAVATIVLAGPIVTLLLERGAFDASARDLTVWPLRLYAAGLVTFAVEALVVPFYFALGDTRTPVLIGIAGVLVNIGLTAALIGPLGVGGVAAALTVSKSLKLVALGGLLRYKRPELRWLPALASVARLGLAAGGATVAMLLVSRVYPPPGATASLAAQVSSLALTSGLGALLFTGLILAVASPERALLVTAWQETSQLARQAWRHHKGAEG